MTTAKVLKVSESGDSIFVNVKMNKYDTKGISGYVANPDKNVVGDVIEGFPMPTGVENRINSEGEQMCTKDGTPLSWLVF